MHVDTLKKWNIAITTQMRSAQCDAAIRLFKYMPRRSTVSYNAMISGYLLNDNLDLARDLFDKMPQRDLFSWNVMITGYVRNKNLGAARELFDKMPERDVVSWNAMLSGYAQNGYVDDAREVFERMPKKNVVSWNGLLAAYVQSGRIEEARRLFELRADWELISWNRLIYGFVKRKRLVDARRLFDQMPVKDNVSWNTMITGYAQNGELQKAQRLFGESPIRDVFAWTAMVSGYVQNGMLDEAKRIFDEMPEKNPVSWNAMIAGYVQCKRIDIARELFEAMPCRDAGSWNTMITGYAQTGNIVQARNLFDRMPQRDSISWAAIIAGYAQSGHRKGALDLFVEMTRDGESPNAFSFSCTLSTCANIGLLELGKQLHGRLIKAGFENRCYVGNALLTMYCKCRNINEAYDVFEGVAEKDLVLWNTMITGFVRHGFGNEALMVFESMKTTGIKPNDVTMIGVLSACSHTGLVERGTEYFYTMNQNYGITANVRHYTCMIDLLGRAGRLDEAQNLMRNMPFAPDAATWGAVLDASRIHGYTELRKKAEMIFKMNFANSGMYNLLSSLNAASDRWGDVGKMRLKVRNEGVRKVPEHSWVEVQNQIHTFSIGDSSHPLKDRIYDYLAELDLQMKQERYVSSPKLVSDDVE